MGLLVASAENRIGQAALSNRRISHDSGLLSGNANSLKIADTAIEDTPGDKNSLIPGIVVSSV